MDFILSDIWCGYTIISEQVWNIVLSKIEHTKNDKYA